MLLAWKILAAIAALISYIPFLPLLPIQLSILVKLFQLHIACRAIRVEPQFAKELVKAAAL